jgi:hypothetical protein
MRWPILEPTLRSDPAGSPGVFPTASLTTSCAPSDPRSSRSSAHAFLVVVEAVAPAVVSGIRVGRLVAVEPCRRSSASGYDGSGPTGAAGTRSALHTSGGPSFHRSAAALDGRSRGCSSRSRTRDYQCRLRRCNGSMVVATLTPVGLPRLPGRRKSDAGREGDFWLDLASTRVTNGADGGFVPGPVGPPLLSAEKGSLR